MSRNLESNLLKILVENCEKSTFHPKITNLSLEFRLVIGTTHTQTDGQTDAGQSDPYVPLCFAGDTKMAVELVPRTR